MALYYVKHPNLDMDAKVNAPTTEKARTTFLDYLERTGVLPRSQRQSLRVNLVAERMSDQYIDADVELSYRYEQEESRGVPVPGRLLESAEERVDIDRFLQEDEPAESMGEVEIESGPLEQKPPRLGRMPIQDIALGGLK